MPPRGRATICSSHNLKSIPLSNCLEISKVTCIPSACYRKSVKRFVLFDRMIAFAYFSLKIYFRSSHMKGGGSLVVDSMLIVTSIVWLCNCSMFCCTLLMSILVLLSSQSGRKSWLLCLVFLSGVSWLLCSSSLRCPEFVCDLWLCFFLIIHTYYFWYVLKISL